MAYACKRASILIAAATSLQLSTTPFPRAGILPPLRPISHLITTQVTLPLSPEEPQPLKIAAGRKSTSFR